MRLLKKITVIIMCLSMVIALTPNVHADTEVSDNLKVVQVSLGRSHSAALKEDGSLWMWGDNSYGQLGDGTEIDKTEPVKIMDDVVQVSLGDFHSAAIKEDGTLLMWGRNDARQLGDGTIIRKNAPIKIMDNVVQVSLGGEHSAAIKDDGSLWMWGDNEFGQLGDGTVEERYNAVETMKDAVQVSLGHSHSAAVKKDGSLLMWGSYMPRYVATLPTEITRDISQISLGRNHNAALKEDGRLWMWGDNSYGQLGDGTNEHKYSPEQITVDIVNISLGNSYSAAIKKDGTLWMWGQNSDGRIGDGTTTLRDIPVRIMITGKAAQVSLGYAHSAVIKEDGSLWMWGDNSYGQLGDGSKTKSMTPKEIIKVVVDEATPTPTIVPNPSATPTQTPIPTEKPGEPTVTKEPDIPTEKPNKPTVTREPGTTTEKPNTPTPTPNTVKDTDITKAVQEIIADDMEITYGEKNISLNAKTNGNGKLTYESGNEKIVSVSDTGIIKTKRYGKTEIIIRASSTEQYNEAVKIINITVIPKSPQLKKVKSDGKRKLSVAWKKDKSVSGYQIYFSANKKFKRETYKRNFKKNASKMNVVGLKSKKTYYVKIRAYSKVGSKKYYSEWSTIKRVKIK